MCTTQALRGAGREGLWYTALSGAEPLRRTPLPTEHREAPPGPPTTKTTGDPRPRGGLRLWPGLKLARQGRGLKVFPRAAESSPKPHAPLEPVGKKNSPEKTQELRHRTGLTPTGSPSTSAFPATRSTAPAPRAARCSLGAKTPRTASRGGVLWSPGLTRFLPWVRVLTWELGSSQIGSKVGLGKCREAASRVGHQLSLRPERERGSPETKPRRENRQMTLPSEAGKSS
ncbi:uncharacterized protein [Physeter macrocephalus]|uniref:Uncharacterized protein n=1 Tax=Physeter macrocephalus TaxID=9755 RepID=A0A455BBJ4_PHYMC|nr:uncharacterized protein LOC114486406 [Physeter catodon]|eukprot:XP_028346137.1 uncharacterized protein LOC114486406 [Physeter catodon]